MTTPSNADFVDATLVRWRRAGADGTFAPGLVFDGRVWTLAGLPGTDGSVLHAGLLAREHGVDWLVDQVTGRVGAPAVSVAEIEVGVPLTDPDKILCLGLNYVDHASEAGFEPPEFPVIFSKFRNCLVGPNDAVIIPRASDKIDFEGELAVIIGRRAKYVAREDALDYVAAYCVFNDVTARDLQVRTSQWVSGKALDTFAPMGPGLVPAEIVPDPQNLAIRTTVSGEVMQDDTTRHMIFDVAGTIAYFSDLMTLEPGDVIATGTPAGVGFKRQPPRYLRPGDVVEVAIGGIGTLRNPVIAEASGRRGARVDEPGGASLGWDPIRDRSGSTPARLGRRDRPPACRARCR